MLLAFPPRFAGSPVGHGEQREPRSIRGEPRWTETCTHTHSHTHTCIHTLSHSHVICYPICTVTKLPVTPGPWGEYGHTHTLIQYVHTSKHSQSHTKVMELCDCARTHTNTQKRCLQYVTGSEDSCSLSCSLEWKTCAVAQTHTHTHGSQYEAFHMFKAVL